MSFFDQRMPQKRQRAYETLCKTLQAQGVDSSEKAKRSLSAVNQKALQFSLFLIMIGGILLIMLPHAQQITLVFLVIGLLGVLSGSVRSKKLIARYISELEEQGR